MPFPAGRAALLLLAFAASLALAGCSASGESPAPATSPASSNILVPGASLGPGSEWCEDVPAQLVTILLEEPVTRVSGSSGGCVFLGSSDGTTVVVAVYPDRGPETLATIMAAGPTIAVDGIGDEAVLAQAECQRACVAVEMNTLSVLEGDALVSVSYPGLADRAGALDAARAFAALALRHLAGPGSGASPSLP